LEVIFLEMGNFRRKVLGFKFQTFTKKFLVTHQGGFPPIKGGQVNLTLTNLFPLKALRKVKKEWLPKPGKWQV